MQLFILNRTNERQTKSVGRILLYALLFFIVTRIAVMLMLTGCTAIYMANTGINPMQGLSFFRKSVRSGCRHGMVGIAVRAARSTFFRRVLFSAGTFVPAVAGSGWIGGTDALFRLAVFSDSRGAAFFLVGASGRYRCSGAAIWIYYRCFLAG